MADSSQSIIDQLNTSMLGPQSGSTGTATAADFLPSLQQADQQALGNLSNNTGGSSSSSGSIVNNLWNGLTSGWTTGWNSIEDNPITNKIVDPVMNAAAGVTNMFSAMAPDENKPLSWDMVNPLNPIKEGINAFWQGYNNPETTPLGREDSAWRGFVGNSLDPNGPMQSPFQSIQQGWNNPTSSPTYRSIANDFLLRGNDVPYVSDALGFATSFTNPINKALANVPIKTGDNPFYRSDLPGAYQAPETVGSVPQMPLSQQPFNVLSKAPNVNLDNSTSLDSYRQSNLSSTFDQSPKELQTNVQAPDSPYLNEFNQSLQDEFNRLKDIRNNPPGMLDNGGLMTDTSATPYHGGEITGSFKPTSGNPQWYRDFYAQFDRKPTNNELMKIAKDNLLNGEKDSFFGDTPSWKPQAAQELESQMDGIGQMMLGETNPDTLGSLGKTLEALQQEHDNIVSEAQRQIQQGYKPTVNINQPEIPLSKEAAATTETPSISSSMPTSKPGVGISGRIPFADSILNSVKGAKDALGKAFVKNYQAPDELVRILNKHDSAEGADQFKILRAMDEMNREHGLSNDEYHSMGDVVEGTKQPSSLQQTYKSKFENYRDNGISNSTGTNALVNEGLLDQASVNPNYFTHMYDNIPPELKGVFPKAGNGVPGLSPNGTFQLPRTFGTLEEARNAGLKPVSDPAMVLGNHLRQTSRAINNARAIQEIKSTPGLLFDAAKVDEVKKLVKTGRMNATQAAQQLGMSLEELNKGFVKSSIPQLNGSYIRPAAERAIHDYLNRVDKDNAWNSLLNAWKKGTTFNSLFHMKNITYNGFWLGGAKPTYVWQTLKNLVTKKDDPWLEKALYDGAIRGDQGSFTSQLKNAGKSNKLDYALHGFLWDVDRALRTSLYRQAVEKGMSGEQAAARAKKFMVDYNNLTPFEDKYLASWFPFYRWMKGNMPLQAEQLVKNPRQMAYVLGKPYALNALQHAVNGQDAGQDDKLDIGTLPNGQHIKIGYNLPGDDISEVLPIDKLLSFVEQATNGKSFGDRYKGPLPYLWGVSSPFGKEIAEQGTNRAYYPSETLAPEGKGSMAQTTIRNDQAPADYNARTSIAHALNTFLPALNVGRIPLGTVLNTIGNFENNGGGRGLVDQLMGLQTKDNPSTTPIEYAMKILGGTSSRDNPAMDKYYEQRNQHDDLKKKMQYERQNGQQPSKAEKKQAYKKIQYPGGSTNSGNPERQQRINQVFNELFQEAK